MGIKKMSLATIQGKLSRQEMKSIMAGSGGCTATSTGYKKCCLSETNCSECLSGLTCQNGSYCKEC
jgi:hypothetical protein